MLYMDDHYFEVIDCLPNEVKARLSELRQLDHQVLCSTDKTDERANFLLSNAQKMTLKHRDTEFKEIKKEYAQALEIADKKVVKANEAHSKAEWCLQKLNLDIQEFKTRLEERNPGITDLLEKRSLEEHDEEVSRKSGAFTTARSSKQSSKTHKIGEQYDKLAHIATNKPRPRDSFGNFQVTHESSTKLKTMGMGTAAIADASSKAMAATQQLQQRRRNVNVGEVSDLGFRRDQDAYATRQLFGNADIKAAAKQAFVATLGAAAIVGQDQTRKSAVVVPNQPERLQRTTQELGQSVTAAEKWVYNPNTNGPRYCICNAISYGEMVACDNEHCPIEWFHFPCVGMTTAPEGKWYCPQCRNEINKKKRRGRRP